MKEFERMAFIKKLISFSPRQLEGERRAGLYIREVLKDAGIPLRLQNFTVLIPSVIEAKLEVDGKLIDCESCSFKSGEIKGKAKMLSSLISSQILQDEPNINFNPACKAISQSNFYFAPSLAIAAKDISKIVGGKKVGGVVKMEKIKHKAFHILAGNMDNPDFVFFAHYDSLKKGATDNASGVAVCLDLLLSDAKIGEKSLFVFAANEEISFDKPVYWGHGFRVFEKKYEDILSKAKKIIVVDSVGNSAPILFRNKKSVRLSFPVANLDKLIKKVVAVAGETDILMKVYHSDDDDLNQLSEENLNLTLETIKKIIKKED